MRARGGGLLVSLAMLPALLANGGMAAADDQDVGPTVVVTAADAADVRVAVTFPAGWRQEASDLLGRSQVDALTVDERCEVSTRTSEFGDLQTDVNDFVVGLAPGSGYTLIERASLELPAAPAERVDFADQEGAQWSVYVVADMGHMHELWCRADALPVDRWLAVAETFELDPPAELTSSAFEPLVSRPDAGVALSFPEEWHVRGSSTDLGLLYATSPTAVCAVSDYTSLAADNGWASVVDMHDAYVASADERADISVDESGYLDLPAGRTGFADLSFDDGTQAVRYSFADPERGTLLALFCIGDPTPDDRYRSLAESVTWLPADEG